MDSLTYGDIDELRRALKGMLQPAAREDADETTAEEPPLVSSSSTGGPGQSQLGGSEKGTDSSNDTSADKTIKETFGSCGLTLRAQLVMGGAAVWPAALALAQWLLDNPDASAGAR